MRLSRDLRRLTLAVHVVSSVGWLGVAYALLVMASTALLTGDPVTRQGTYALMLVFDLAAALPLGLIALASGLLLGLGSHWGVLKHWWVVIKLGANLAVLVVPLLARRPAVMTALESSRAGMGPGDAGTRVLAASIAATLVLTVATVLSIYKPLGRVRVTGS
jgi:hypothetical protein